MRLEFCALCGENDITALEHHHFRPKALGGSDDEKNMFTVCGTCHGDIHDIPRPLRLGELVKVGYAKALERTASDWRGIAERRSKQAERAEDQAQATALARKRELQADIRRLRPVPSPSLVPEVAPDLPDKIIVMAPLRTGFSRYRRPMEHRALQKDKQFRVSGEWALASDGIQWILKHNNGSIKFIRSTKAHLADRMSKMMPSEDADRLLDGLPDTFDEWRLANEAFFEAAETKAA